MNLNYELFEQSIKLFIILFGLCLGWISTSGTKSQNIRIIDILIIGPLMIYFGWKSKHILFILRLILIFLGSTTITYNLKNFIKQQDELNQQLEFKQNQ